MAGRIWRNDGYDLRKFMGADITTFIDIGAMNGTTSIMARLLFPFARVIGIEPHPLHYKLCVDRGGMGIEFYNFALGDGGKMHADWHELSGWRKFWSEEDKKKGWWPDTKDWPENKYEVDSKTLPQIFKWFKINTDRAFILKIDCEGGERFILGDQKSAEIIKKSDQTNFELHAKLGGTMKEWNEYLKQFEATHVLRLSKWFIGKDEKMMVYIPIVELDESWGRCQIELVHRKHAGRPY
jgi:FkbM family methyltransferase